MNRAIYRLSLSRMFSNSPAIVNRGHLDAQNIVFSNCFCSMFLTYGSMRVIFTSFIKNLDTSVQIDSLENINITYTIYSSFNYDNENIFHLCTFQSISSFQKSSGILFQTNGILNITYCRFINLTASYSGAGGTALYATAGTSLNLYCNSFINCYSPHGASVGIHNNGYPIASLIFTFNSEIFVGYRGSQGHSSYIGARNKCECSDCNVSYINSNGSGSGLFYFLSIPKNSVSMSRCCLAHSVITYLIRLLNSSPTTISKTSFINNSASEWVN